jgi:hypothetical protein
LDDPWKLRRQTGSSKFGDRTAYLFFCEEAKETRFACDCLIEKTIALGYGTVVAPTFIGIAMENTGRYPKRGSTTS